MSIPMKYKHTLCKKNAFGINLLNKTNGYELIIFIVL